MRQRLYAGPISARTKGERKSLRKDGFVPVSIQHRGEETLHLQEEAKPLEDFIHNHGEAELVELVIQPENTKQTVLVHTVQRDPLTQKLLQVTFQKVSRGDTIKVHMPIVLHGEPEAVRNGAAMLQRPIEVVEVHCKPANLPDHLTIDISGMEFGTPIRVSDLPQSSHYEIVTPPDTVLASLVSLLKHADAEPTPAETITETVAPAEEAETTKSA